jgi:hypothetical protein
MRKEGKSLEIVDLTKHTLWGKMMVLTGFIFNSNNAVFHLNGFDFLTITALLFRRFKSKIIFHSHSAHAVESFSSVKSMAFKLFLKKVDECILVGSHLRDTYTEFNYQLPDNTVVQNAFLPPPEEYEPTILKTYDP